MYKRGAEMWKSDRNDVEMYSDAKKNPPRGILKTGNSALCMLKFLKTNFTKRENFFHIF